MKVPLRWIGAPGGQAHRGRPLRVADNRLCGFREGALSRLDAAGIARDMAVAIDNDRSLEATVDMLRQGFAAVQTPTSGPRHIIGLSC